MIVNVVLMTLFGFLMILLFWLMHRKTVEPVKYVVETGQKIASADMARLSTAISELSQGDFSRQLSFDTPPVQAPPQAGMTDFVNIFNSLVESLKDAAQAFNNITGVPCKRLFYVGADSFLEGRKCGEIMGRLLKGQGKVIISAESFRAVNMDLRRRGFLSLIRQKFPDIEVIAQIEASAGGGKAYHEAMTALQKYPAVSGIYIACGSPPAQFAKALVAHEKAGIVKVVCHDLMDDTMRWIKEGVITATLSQNSIAQGYNPVIHMFNHLATGWKPLMPFLLTDLQEVNHDNYREYWHEEKGIVLTAKSKEKMTVPLTEKSAKPLRIAVLGRDETVFWMSIKTGVLEAVKTLENHNVTVDFLVPEEVYQYHDIKTEFYGPMIDQIVEHKYDALVTVAPEKGFIPYINRAVDAGIPVGLYNSDPISLRGLIFTITEQAGTLMSLSENLASSTYQSGEATQQIREAMENVATGTESQNLQVSQTGDALHNLLNTIDMVSKDAELSANETEATTSAVSSGTDAMKNTLLTMKTIEESVSNTWGIVEELGKHSERIDFVVEVITDIASRVNVLALNAAIEATKAGEFGAGFMVVAREIRTLANSTSEATREVSELIHSVQYSIGQVDKVMSDGLVKMKKSSSLTDKAMLELANIQKLVQQDKQRMKNIAMAMVKMQETSHHVGNAMTNVSTISRTNMAAVEEVNKLTREMSEQLQTVADLAIALELMAGSEQQMLAKFILIEGV